MNQCAQDKNKREHPVTGQLVYDNIEKANMFNNFFLSHSTIDLSNARLPNDEITDNAEFINHVEVTEAEVL